MKYHELGDSAKEKARAWMVDCVHSDGWCAEWVIEDWKDILDCLGFYETDIFWSGFGSQGDGACFVGSWREEYVRYDKLVELVGQEKAADYGEFFYKLKLFRDMGAIQPHYVRLNHRGLYSHENSIHYDLDIPETDSETVPCFEEDFKEACRYLMRTIYRQLEAEYAHQVSEEAIVESIECNEYDFNDKGERQ